jgi:hypothetical protein
MPGAILLRTPHRRIAIVIVISERFAIFCLVLFSEVSPTRFVPVEGIEAHKLSKLKEVSNPPCLL